MRAPQGPDPAPPLQDPRPGRHRRQGDRQRDDRRDEEGCDGEMLWRRYHAEEEAAREAEERESQNEGIRQRQYSSGSIHRSPKDGRRELIGFAVRRSAGSRASCSRARGAFESEGWECEHPAGGLYCGVEDGGGVREVN